MPSSLCPHHYALILAAADYETLIGLLSTTGILIKKTIKLDCSDVDWAELKRSRAIGHDSQRLSSVGGLGPVKLTV